MDNLLPQKLWMLRIDHSGKWCKSVDDARDGETYLVAFSEVEAANAAKHQEELYDLKCTPIRVK